MVLNNIILPIIYCPIADRPVLSIVNIFDVHSCVVVEVTDSEFIKFLSEGLIFRFFTSILAILAILMRFTLQPAILINNICGALYRIP